MQSPDHTREKVLWMAIVPQVILLIVSILWIYFSPRDNIFIYLKFNFKTILFGGLTGLFLAALGYGFYSFSKKTKKFYETVELFEQMLAPAFKNLNIADIVLLSMVSGFCEEVFFRGLILPKFGILIASLGFGVLHLPGLKYWIYALWATLSGALFGWFFILSGSLWLPITAHVVNNIIGMILLTKVGKKIQN